MPVVAHGVTACDSLVSHVANETADMDRDQCDGCREHDGLRGVAIAPTLGDSLNETADAK